MHVEREYDVIIAGAGPVGLWIACELGQKGVTTLIIEKKANVLDDPWVMGTLGVRAINHAAAEILYRRGLLSTVFPPNERSGKRTALHESMFVGHYAGNRTDPAKVDFARWKHILPAPTAEAFGGAAKGGPLTSALISRAKALGVKILHGTAISHHHDTGSSVQVWTTTQDESDDESNIKAEQQCYTARYLVGADGGRSAVRRGANFPFVGSEATWTGYSIHCELTDPDILRPGFNRTSQGMYFCSPGMGPFDKGLHYFIDIDGGAGREQSPTVSHVQAMMRKVSEQPTLQIKHAHLMGSFTDRTKQATTYRAGRVFLAGDAAHIHAPIGGQGLNLGLGDAINLGWKLAAVCTGRAANPEKLLDSYSSERVPLGREVLEHTRIQTMGVKTGLHGQAVYNFVTALNDTKDGATFLAERVNWYDRKYSLGGEHWLLGRSAPDFEFADGGRLGRSLEKGGFVLLDFAGIDALKSLATKFGFQYLHDVVGDALGLRAAFVRPDGVVAWAADDDVDATALEVVIREYVTPL